MFSFRIPLFLAAAGSLAGFTAFLAGGPGSPTFSWEALCADQRTLAREWRRSAGLEDELRDVARQSAVRHALVAELVDGKRGLVEVATAFERLDQELPGSGSSLYR